MAYIRATSNPEGLYVFGSVSGFVEWYWWEGDQQKCIFMQPKLFEEVCHRWDEGDSLMSEDDSVQVGGPEVGQTVRVAEQPGQPWKIVVSVRDEPGRVLHQEHGVECAMWPVTWEYIVAACVDRGRRGWLWQLKRLIWNLSWALHGIINAWRGAGRLEREG